MPWKETHLVEERMQFVLAAAKKDVNFTQLCKSFGISRAKGYKWIARYKETRDPSSLGDRPPVAHTCPHATKDGVVDAVVEMRKQYPFDGPKKLRARMLVLEPKVEHVPAASTIGEILKRRGLIRPRRARLHVPPSPLPFEPTPEPNDTWAVDFKGHFPCGNVRCYPLTVTDLASRYLIKCEALVEPRHDCVRTHFERAFTEFGVPKRIRSDNGPPFATKALGGLSHLSVWWVRLGALPERIEPGKPQQNGRHERFHKTLKEQTASPPRGSIEEQQRAFDRFRADYNDKRPHEALGQTPPAQHYEPSPRVMPAVLPELTYDDDYAVRWVNDSGAVSWKGRTLYAGTVLAGQPLGFKQVDEDEHEIYFGPLLIGIALSAKGRVRIEPLS